MHCFTIDIAGIKRNIRGKGDKASHFGPLFKSEICTSSDNQQRNLHIINLFECHHIQLRDSLLGAFTPQCFNASEDDHFLPE